MVLTDDRLSEIEALQRSMEAGRPDELYEHYKAIGDLLSDRKVLIGLLSTADAEIVVLSRERHYARDALVEAMLTKRDERRQRTLGTAV